VFGDTREDSKEVSGEPEETTDEPQEAVADDENEDEIAPMSMDGWDIEQDPDDDEDEGMPQLHVGDDHGL
jgi:hypothetical protein